MKNQNPIRVDHIFKKSWVIFKNQYQKFIVIPIVMMVFLGLMGYLNSYTIINSIEEAGSLIGALLSFNQPALYILTISAILTVVVQYIGLIMLVVLTQRNKGIISYANLIRRAFDNFWKYIGYGIIIALINVLIIFLAYIPTILLGIIIYFVYSNNFDLTFGILGIIPAVATLIYIFYFVFSPFLMTEEKGVIESMRESKAIIRGQWKNIFWRILVMYIIALVLGYVLNLVPYAGVPLALIIFLPLTIIYTFVVFENARSTTVTKDTETKK